MPVSLSHYNILHSYQQCMKDVDASHPCQHSNLSVFLILAISVGVKWYLIMFWICIPWWLMVLSNFSWIYCQYIYLFVEVHLQGFFFFFYRELPSFTYLIDEYFIYCSCEYFIRYIYWKYLLPLYGLFFSFS